MDWNIRYFHGPAYSTHKGTTSTYNSYLIIDDKVTLVDTVYGRFKWVPTEGKLEQGKEYGRNLAKNLKDAR